MSPTRIPLRLNKAGGAVAAALDGGDYLVGARFTIADVVVGGVLDSARRYKLLAELPRATCVPRAPRPAAGEAARLLPLTIPLSSTAWGRACAEGKIGARSGVF
jgi:hypothetical protein